MLVAKLEVDLKMEHECMTNPDASNIRVCFDAEVGILANRRVATAHGKWILLRTRWRAIAVISYALGTARSRLCGRC